MFKSVDLEEEVEGFITYRIVFLNIKIRSLENNMKSLLHNCFTIVRTYVVRWRLAKQIPYGNTSYLILNIGKWNSFYW